MAFNTHLSQAGWNTALNNALALLNGGFLELYTGTQPLTTGANTVTVPTGGFTVNGVMIVPPVTSVITKTLKGVSGDTGIPINTTQPTMLGLNGATSFVIVTSGNETVQFVWY